MPSARAILAVVLVASLSVAPVAGQSGGDYEITLDREVDIPDRTLDTDSGEFTVSAVGRYATGDVVEVTTSAPDNSEYAIRLVDSQERLRASAYAEGDASARFSLDRYDAGTYAVVITNESDADDVYAIKPLVIYGYTVTQQTSSEIEEDSTLTVEFSLTMADDVDVDKPPASVEVALGNDSTSLTTTATRTEDLNYTAEIDTDALSPGDYRLYTGVQRDNTVYGYQELIGVNTYQVSVVEATTATPTPTETQTSTSGSGGGTQSGSSGPTAGTQTSTSTATAETATGTSMPNATRTVTSTATSAVRDTATSSETPGDRPDGDGGTTVPSPTSDIPPTTAVQSESGASTPVSTPVLPDGGVFLLCLVAVAIASRIRQRE